MTARHALTVAVIAILVTTLSSGCGSHQTATKEHSPAATKPTSTATQTTATTPARAKSTTGGGPFVGTCPKLIAANCVPGRKYEGSVVCVGHGDIQTARTPTPADLQHLPGKLSPPPTQIFLHMLPNGKARGICVWGRNPLMQAENN